MSTTTGLRQDTRVLRVLLLENDPTAADAIEHQLHEGGIALEGRRADSRESLLLALQEFLPDVILAAYKLPQLTAVEALAVLRQFGLRIPFILVTGDHVEEKAIECMRDGADDYVLQDNMKRLPSAVRNALERHAALRERERAEDARRASELLYRLIMETTRDLIIMTDKNGRMLYVSPSCERLLGFTPSEILRGDLFASVHPDDRARAVEIFRRSAGDQDNQTLQVRCRNREGEWRVFESVCNWVVSESHPDRAVLIFRDMTKRKQAEDEAHLAYGALERREQDLLAVLEELNQSHARLQTTQFQLMQASKMDAVGQLAAGVAHEVKNPLTVLMLGVEYLQNKLPEAPESIIETLGEMEDAIQRANTVLRGLVDFAAPNNLALADEDLNQIVERTLDLMKHEFLRAQVEVVREFEPVLPPLRLDRNKIEQVLINLFLNAVQAMKDGGTVTVRTRAADGGLGVQLEVDDTGCGIPPDKLDRVFDAFFTTKPASGGTGLGLRVVQSILELHDAGITLVNRKTGGLRATIAFRAGVKA